MQSMSDMSSLYNFCEFCPDTFNVIYIDHENQKTMNFKQVMATACEISDLLKSSSSTASIIGCLMKPGVILPSIIIGILKASSAFVFLNAENPNSSLQALQKYVSITTLIVEEAFLKSLENFCPCWNRKQCITLNDVPIHLLQSEICNRSSCPNSSESPPVTKEGVPPIAYVMQTSGSTGKPKIVQVPHQCILPNIIDLKKRFDVTAQDVLLQCSPLSFDPCIVEIFLAISSGSTLVIVSDRMKCIPRRLISVIKEMKITILQATPSLIQSFGDHMIKAVLLSNESCLRVLAFGGEPCPSMHKLLKWREEKNRTRIFNLYGLTEISCWATCHEIDFSKRDISTYISLGEPLLDTIIEVKEDEVFIGGDKRWCIINEEQCPIDDAKFMRATGDLVTQDSDGSMYFDCRKDFVVKCSGHKIPLQKLYSFLGGFQEVSRFVTHFDAETSSLYVFLTVTSTTGPTKVFEEELLTSLQRNILNIPVCKIITVPDIPLTNHGKANVKKLLELAKIENERIRKCPMKTATFEVEEIVEDLWKMYTKQISISPDDNFVIQGGNSIMAVQLATDIERKLNITVPELIDKILNYSFKDALRSVTSALQNAQKFHFTDAFTINEKHTSEPVSKKIHVCDPSCFEMSSKRGYALKCACSEHHKSMQSMPNSERRDVTLRLELKCKFNLEKCIDASPCAAYFFQSNRALVFIGSHSGLFICANVCDGTEEWIRRLPDRIESSACLSQCGNFLLVGCYDHHLYSLSTTTGAVKWKLETGAEVKSSPVVSVDNVAFVGSHDKHLYAVKVESGAVLWRKQIANGSIFSSPAISEDLGVVAVGTLDGHLAVLKMESGTVLWTVDCGKPLFSSPLFCSSSLFVGSIDNKLLHFDHAGKMINSFQTEGAIYSSPSATSIFEEDYILFGCHDMNIYCIKSDATCVWKFLCDSPVYATPFIFEWMKNNYVIAASSSGMLYIVSLDNGELVHCWKCPGDVFSSPIILNDHVMVGCRDDHLYSFSLCK